MSETDALFAVLQQSADPDVVAAIELLGHTGSDRELSRINALDLRR